jgi:hypothetical protein
VAVSFIVLVEEIYNIRTLSVNIKFICTSFRNKQNSEPLASFSGLFRSEYKYILYLTTMYVYCVYPAMSKKSENLSDLDKKDRTKRHSSPFITVVKGVFFVVRVTLIPVSFLSAPSAVHSYRVPGKFIRLVRIKQKFIRIAYLYSKCTDCRINRSTRREPLTFRKSLTLSHNVVSSTPCLSGIWTHNVSADRHWLHR